MNELERIAFEIISNVGASKSLFMKAISLAEEENIDEAKKTYKEAREELIKGHKVHMNLITKEANNELGTINLILMHAEDQLMTTELLMELCQKFINVYEKINEIKDN